MFWRGIKGEVSKGRRHYPEIGQYNHGLCKDTARVAYFRYDKYANVKWLAEDICKDCRYRLLKEWGRNCTNSGWEERKQCLEKKL